MGEVALRSSHEVLVENDVSSALIVGDPQRILGQQLRPHLIKYYYYYYIS
jgi:hypothetical protein